MNLLHCLRSSLRIAVLMTFGGALLASAASKPNILFIVGDDMGYADVGFHGCKEIPTPNLDALAASGVRFPQGYVTGPYCSPTRAGLLSGRYQQKFGHEFNPTGDDGMPTTVTTVADRLRGAGYRTALVGKWHLGSAPGMHPLERGFDEFFGFLGGAHSYFQKQGVLRGTNQVTELDYTTDAFGREAIAFIERNKSKPWFLYLAFNAVHTPMDATPERLARFANVKDEQRRAYCAMMLAMDEAIGKVRAKVAEAGLVNDTLVLFISDNGGPVMRGVTINASINSPLRGSKRTTLEGGIRVPFLLSWPTRLKPGVYENPVIQLDATYTALVAAGVQVKPEWQLDGVDLMPFLRGERKGLPHQTLYWRFGQQMAIRDGDFKLVRYDAAVDSGEQSRGDKVSDLKLYNLTKDIGESHDLASQMPDKVRELQAKWDAWDKTLVPPAWGGGARRAGRARQ
jgi:arylsulfatase A-like enzyme